MNTAKIVIVHDTTNEWIKLYLNDKLFSGWNYKDETETDIKKKSLLSAKESAFNLACNFPNVSISEHQF